MDTERLNKRKPGTQRSGSEKKEITIVYDPEATHMFEQNVAVYCKRLYKYLYCQCFDEELSKDILQDTMVQAQQQFSKGLYEEKGLIWYWLQKIAKNNLLGHYRLQSRRNGRFQENKHQICDNLGWAEKTSRISVTGTSSADPVWETSPEERCKYNISANMELLMQTDFKLLVLSDAERYLIRERHLRMKTFKELTCKAGEPLSTLMSRYYTIMKKVQRQLVDLEAMGVFDKKLSMEEMQSLLKQNPLEKKLQGRRPKRKG